MKKTKPSKNLTHSLIIKFSDEDRKKITAIQERGFNVTQLFRNMINKEYKKIQEENESI